jgi:hypothetical protein
MRALQLWCVSVAVVAVGACGGKSGPEQMTGVAAAASGDDAGMETEEPGATEPGATATSAGVTSATGEAPEDPTGDDTAVGFIVPPDGGVSGECDPRAQDCPEGQKCTAVSPAPGDPWGVNICVEVTGDGLVGDPCDVEGGKYTGVDNCVAGAICLLTDEEGQGGVCVEFCDVNSACPQTPTAKCVVYNSGSLPICLGSCDPIVQDCPEGQGCYNSAGDQFVCFKESAMPGEGGIGAECQYINQCQKGGFCAATDSVVNCSPTSLGCCTPFCPVSGGNAPCQQGEDCVPFFEPGSAPPAYEDVGVCVIPA